MKDYTGFIILQDKCYVTNIHNCPGKWSSFFDAQAALIFVGWFFFQAVLYMIPVGKVVQGPPIIISNHQRLPYRCNGKVTKVNFQQILISLTFKYR